MGNYQVMPKVDFQKENLKTAYIYSKYMESKNLARYSMARSKIIQKRITLGISLAAVIAIYSFTISRIKQETFLDDFEEPVRVDRN